MQIEQQVVVGLQLLPALADGQFGITVSQQFDRNLMPTVIHQRLAGGLQRCAGVEKRMVRGGLALVGRGLQFGGGELRELVEQDELGGFRRQIGVHRFQPAGDVFQAIFLPVEAG